MRLTPSQQAILRSRPQSTQLYLSVYSPKTLFAVQVTGSYSQGDVRINYSAPSTGTWFNTYPNMEVLVGSVAGDDDVARIRLRGATGTYIDVAENEIIWQQGQFLTFIDQVEIQAIYPRIIQNPNSQTDVIFYKDWDIPYSNQNTIYGTFPCAGPHRAGFIVTGSAGFFFSATGTYNVKGDTLTYSWAFEGGTPTGSTAITPGVVQWTQPGHYKVRLITTSSSGAIDTTYRYVSVYQKPNQGTNNPIEPWELLQELSGSRGEGGYTARIKILNTFPDIQPNALVVIFAEDVYGGTITSLGGNAINNSSIVFVGYVLKNTIRFNYQQSTMEFDVGSVSEVMKISEGFSVSCESKVTASTWYELTEMTWMKALYHYLRWHSTVLNVTDFQALNDDRFVQYFDSDRASLFDAVDNFMRGSLLGTVISDRQGKLWAEISHFGQTTPFSTVPQSGMPLNKQDWMGDPSITERRVSDASFVELGGIAYYGASSNTFSALLSDAPGLTPLYHGKPEGQEGLILLSQAQLNQVSANYLAFHNTPFPEVTLNMNGNYRNLDIAPQEQQFLVVSPSDTIRNISLQTIPYQVISMTWQYNSKDQSFYPDATFEAMATGTMSESVFIPVTPPYQDSGFDYPSLQLPTLPIFNPSDSVGPSVPMKVILHDAVAGLIYTGDFDSIAPSYITVNAGLTAAQYQAINWIGVCPNGAIYVAKVPSAGSSFLARADSIGGIFTVLYEGANINDANYIWGVGIDPTSTERIGFIRGADSANKFYVGANGTWSAGVALNDNKLRSDGISYGGTDLAWILTYFGQVIKINGAGTSITSTTTPAVTPNHLRAGITGVVYTNKNGAIPDVLMQTMNNFTTPPTEINTTDAPTVGIASVSNYMSCDPSGRFSMTRALAGAKGKSSDFGFTFTPIPSLPPGNYWFAYAGQGTGATDLRFIAAGGSVVRFTPDFGTTWQNKEDASLLAINPLLNLNMVKVVG